MKKGCEKVGSFLYDKDQNFNPQKGTNGMEGSKKVPRLRGNNLIISDSLRIAKIWNVPNKRRHPAIRVAEVLA